MALWYTQALVTRDQFAWAERSHTVEYATAHAWLETDKPYVDVFLLDHLREASWETERTLVGPVLASEYRSNDPAWFQQAVQRAGTLGYLVILEITGRAKEEL